MAEWHLKELRKSLEKRSWRLIAQLPSDDHNISAYWQFQRSPKESDLIIAFHGLDDLSVLPLPKAYGCYVVGQPTTELYFKKRSLQDKARHKIWQTELNEFIRQVEFVVTNEFNTKAKEII